MKLICFYDIKKYKEEERVFAPSAATVIDYIAYTLNRLNIQVEIISPAETRKVSGKFPMRSELISDGITLTQGASNGYRNKILRIISKIQSRLWLVKYLLKNTKKNEVVFFWDSPVLYEPLIIFRKLDKKNVKILYFASEIFQEVLPLGRLKRKMEWKLFEDVDMFLVSTEMLDKKINHTGKKSVLLHGTYRLTHEYNSKFNDGKIHVLYAGIINKTKGSGKAVEIASYLPEKFHINIIGYGKKEDIDILNASIEKSNSVNPCKITYDGTLFGEEYNRYLQKCDIGICSQNINAKYNESSFPSKILSYLSNGLRVVSVDIKAIHSSEIGDLLYYTKTDSAKDFAKTIINIDMNIPYNSRKAIENLDKKFMTELSEMLDGYEVR